MNIETAFPSKYASAADLGESQPVVTIERVAMEPVGNSREMKPVIYFVGKQKGMVLNRTNSKRISEMVGSGNTDHWPGVKLQLFATTVEFQGKPVQAIRIKVPLLSAARAQAAQSGAGAALAPPPPPPMSADDEGAESLNLDDVAF